MALNFSPVVPVTALSNDKQPHLKIIKLTSADFSTGGTASVKAVIPADASILEMTYWKKTAFSGGGITAATLSIGITGTATYFANAFDVHTPAAGTRGSVTPMTNLIQDTSLPLGSDYSILVTGTATTGNPTAGELYIEIRYVR